MPISKREESEPTMLQSLEAYYEERLKGKTADEIRKELADKGVTLIDTPQGTKYQIN